MDIILVWMYTYLGLGILLGLVVSLVIIIFGKKMYPLIHIAYELRDGNKVATILKAKKIVDKNGKTSFFTKPSVLSYGIKGLMSKRIIMPPPDFADITTLKEGGNLLISFSPARNIFLPVKMIVEEKSMKMMPKFELLKTWFKTALIDLTKNKLLRPQLKWEKIVPIAMMGMFIIMMFVFMIVIKAIPDSMNTITDTFGRFVVRMEESTGTITSAGSSMSSAIPVG